MCHTYYFCSGMNVRLSDKLKGPELLMDSGPKMPRENTCEFWNPFMDYGPKISSSHEPINTFARHGWARLWLYACMGRGTSIQNCDQYQSADRSEVEAACCGLFNKIEQKLFINRSGSPIKDRKSTSVLSTATCQIKVFRAADRSKGTQTNTFTRSFTRRT